MTLTSPVHDWPNIFPSLVNLLLSRSFLIKISSLSAPTKIEELKAGSDGKWVRFPAGLRCVFPSDPPVSSSIFVGAKREENLIFPSRCRCNFCFYRNLGDWCNKLTPTWIFTACNGACVHYVMVCKYHWKPFLLATQLDPQNDWTG